jgi:Fe-S cluster assembly ATP-binding protein
VSGADAAHVFEVRGLHASVGGREVLHGIDLAVRSGEVHVIMGPNGSGKSTLAHALMGRPGTEVTAGSIAMDGRELSGLPAWERARAGLFLALQHPVEVPGVGLHSLLGAAMAADGDGAGETAGEERALDERMAEEAKAVGLDARLLRRPLNVDLSGGERKRTEMVQLGVLRPAVCILDEVDSGLDVDALGEVARRLQRATSEWGVGILAITHFNRFLVQLEADLVHVMVDGRIVATGDADLALQLEQTGYRGYRDAG